MDLVNMCDLATNWSSWSNSSRNHALNSNMVFNTADNEDNRSAGHKGPKKNVNVNVKDGRPDRKVDCWNSGGN